MRKMNRRQFAVTLPGLVAIGPVVTSEAQVAAAQPHELKPLRSGIFTPGAPKAGQQGHSGQQILAGMLAAGNIRLEMHESVQQPGAPHEAVGTHKHNEIWFVMRGVATLFIKGEEHRIETGEVGIVCAGDTHWIANAGDTELAYLVITVGPPE